MDHADYTAIWITFKLAVITTAILLVLSTPLAWWLAHTKARFRILVESIVALPLVLPASMATSAYMFPELPTWAEVQSAVYLVLLYDLLMVTTGLFFYHYVVES